MMGRTWIAVLVAGLGLVAVGVAGSRPQRAAAEAAGGDSFVIDDVRVFDGERVLEARRVLVRAGKIAAIGGSAPAGASVIDGRGGTLLPGLIDAHTHAFGDALERALVFGVTTELDMFTEHRFAAGMRADQRRPEGAPGRADLVSAGTLVTAPGGHGTEYGLVIPTISTPAEAQAFVDARIAEGSDYIKIVYDGGESYGRRIPTIDRDTLEAVVAAAKARGVMALVHVGSRRGADEAIAAGASGLIHVFADTAADEAFAGRVRRAGAFVTPTLSVIESTTGTPAGASLTTDAALGPILTGPERASLNRSFPKRAGSILRLDHALQATRLLHAAGVPILAGTDAPNPGTAHGVSIHRELELLVRAGLRPAAALAAATSVPARIFSLGDRGQIAVGRRADLVLVEGDPTSDIGATRAIAAVWKGGVRAERRPADATPPTEAAATTSGLVSDFEEGKAQTAFGSGWQVSTDAMMGGKSAAAMRVVEGGAGGSRGALEITGTMAAGAPYPWAGAMFFPGSAPMQPVDLSRFSEIAFHVRGDGAEYQLMVFADRLGNIPATHAFPTTSSWQEIVVPFSAFPGLDGSDLKGVLFSAGAGPGPFRLEIDDVRFRR